MRMPKAPARGDTSARKAARAAGRIRYPFGKALARIRFFEKQRGMDLTRYEEGRVVTGRAGATSRGSRSRAKSGRASPRVPYATTVDACVQTAPTPARTHGTARPTKGTRVVTAAPDCPVTGSIRHVPFWSWSRVVSRS